MRQCLSCLELKKYNSFRELKEFPKPHFENTFYCTACTKADRAYDAWVNQILKGVTIPQYETPVTKTYNPDIINVKHRPERN